MGRKASLSITKPIPASVSFTRWFRPYLPPLPYQPRSDFVSWSLSLRPRQAGSLRLICGRRWSPSELRSPKEMRLGPRLSEPSKELSETTEAHSQALAEMEQKREAERRATEENHDAERRASEQMHDEAMGSAKREVMQARLQFVNSERGAIEQAIQKLRSAETFEDERRRAREMRSIHIQEMLIYWARDAHTALSDGGRSDLASQFLLEGCDLSTADRVEEVYTRLIGIVDLVMTPS